jgi:two-component system, cell cycle response regulator
LSPLDKVNRLIGYHLLRDYNISAFSTLSKSAVISHWYRILIFSCLITLSVLIILTILTYQIIINQSKIQAQKKLLYTLAHTDELTNLCNRRSFDILLKKELKRVIRHHKNLSLFMVDIDYFKFINDTYGHDNGDRVLQEIARVFLGVSREEDTICRYGGEEFLIMLPENNLENALLQAERLRKTIENKIFKINSENVNITVSIGVSTYKLATNDITPTKLIKDADDALYNAKNSGRNKVCTT